MQSDDALAQLRAAGLELDTLDTSGTLTRVPVEGDRRPKCSGWYVARLRRFTRRQCDECGSSCLGHEVISGLYGNWKNGFDARIEYDTKPLTDHERRALREQHRRDRDEAAARRAEMAQQAATRAAKLWRDLPDEGRSPYLDRKQVRAFGLRFARDGAMVVPVCRLAVEDPWPIVGLQFISADGGKKFLTGTAKAGAAHLVGAIVPDRPIVIAEGYATAASILMATSWPVVVAFDAGNLLPVACSMRELYPQASLVIAADDDHATPGNPGRTKALDCAQRVQGSIALPVFRDGPHAGCTDFNDLHVREGLPAVRACLEAALRAPEQKSPPARSAPSREAPVTDSWPQALTRTKAGDVKPDIFNVVTVLAQDPRWQGVLGYCDFSYRIVKRRPPPIRDGVVGEWTDADTTRLRVWMAEHYGFTPKTGDADEGVLMAAQAHRFHPVREYLESLMWDEVPRVDTWLCRYLGAPDTPYVRAVGRYWLLAAVARVMRPPVKADCVMILEGLQGLGKSTALEILGGEWFSDTHFALGEKDGYQQMCGVWICELAELDSFNKAESTRAKQFFGSKEDRYRPAYGRRAATFARQCVFAGSTNQDNYLKDHTGNRRYWPIACLDLDARALAGARNQLWAEAVALYLDGHRWWPGDDERHLFKDEQEKRFQSDVWEDLIKQWLLGSTTEAFTVAEIFRDGLKMSEHQMKPPEEQRIGRIMGRLGWQKARRFMYRDGARMRLWAFERPKKWGDDED